MSIFDELPEIISDATSELVFKDVTLNIKGAGVSDGQGGFTYPPVAKACRGMITEYSDFARSQGGIPAGDRKGLILAASLESGVTPKPGQSFTGDDGVTYSIIDVKRDPSSSVWTLQCRKPGG